MADFIEEFSDELHPQIKKAVIVNPTIQHSIGTAMSTVIDGWWPQVYAPRNLDLVRWKLGRYWDDKGNWAEDNWRENGLKGTLWVTEPDWIMPVCSTNDCGAPGEKKELIKVARNPVAYGLKGDPSIPGSEENGNAAWLWIVDSTQNTLYSEEDQRTRNAPSFEGVQGVSVFGNPSVGVRGKVFYDHAFEIEMPHAKKSIEKALFGSVRVSYADIKPTYNFYVGSYECTIDDPAVDERILPNMYAFLLVEQQQFGNDVIINNDPTSINNIFEKNVTLNGLISGTLFAADPKGKALPNVAAVIAAMENKEEKLGKVSSKGQYYDKFANKYSAFNTSSDTNIAYRDKLTNLIVPQTDLSLYKDFNSKRFNFPMCVDISFSTDVNTEFAQALKQSKLSSAFMKSRTYVPNPAIDAAKKLGDVDIELFSGSDGWKVPKNAGLILWAGVGPATGFVQGFKIHIAQSDIKVIESWTGVDSLYLGDKVGIANWNGVYFQRDPRTLLGVANREFTQIADTTELIVPSVARWRSDTGTTFFKKGNLDIKNLMSRNIEDRDWKINIIGYWKDWEPNHMGNWGGDVELLQDLTDAGSSPNMQKRDKYSRWEAYSLIARQRELLDNSFLDVIDISSGIKTHAQLKQWDLTKWVEELASTNDGFISSTNNDDITYLGPYNQEIQAAQNSNSNSGDTQFFRTLMTIIVAGKFSKLVQEKTRTFAQILNEEKAYSETVFYKVEKWALNRRGDFANGKPIQSIYLPNSNEIDVHRYIDTQVKYGKRYGYKILAYQAVFGNRYRYVLNRVPESTTAQADSNPWKVNAGEAEICVFTSPSVRLIEVPYYTFKGIVMDSPPIWPDVNIMPYMKENDKVLFFFQGNVGNYKLNPITILREDSIDIDKIRDAQKTYVGPIEYKSDDQAKTFQVFRTTRMPKTYQDFSEWKLKDVETDVFEEPQPQKSATAAAFLDDIAPNTKYYYMFRSVDIHDHVSNPSPIYEIEIVDSGGAPVLLTKVHPLVKEIEPPQKPAKCMKKYIYITPNPVHLQVNKSESGLTTDNGKVNELPGNVIQNGPVLGVGGETIWGKKFKIRLVSKKTGKKLDFKLEFKTEHEVPTDQGDLNGGQKIC